MRLSRFFALFGTWLFLAGAAHTGENAPPSAPARPAQRLVSLAPSLTELAFAAGAGDRLVGVSAYSDHPAAANALPRVADANGINWEALLALKPDLVLVWEDGTRPADTMRLDALGIARLSIAIRALDDIAPALLKIGRATGRDAAASVAARAVTRDLAALAATNAGKPRLRAFIEIGDKPLMTVSRAHLLSEMLARCDGDNVFADAPALVVEPVAEAVLQRDPQVLLRSATAGAGVPAALAPLRAAQEGRIYRFTADHAFRPGPRSLLAAKEICAALDLARASLGMTR